MLQKYSATSKIISFVEKKKRIHSFRTESVYTGYTVLTIKIMLRSNEYFVQWYKIILLILLFTKKKRQT